MKDRNRKEMAAGPFSLPKDVMIEILLLLKLSVRSLIRLSAVNKAALSLIRSPEFVSLYRSYFATEQFFCRSTKDGGNFALISDHLGPNTLSIELGPIINPDNKFPIRFWDNFHPLITDNFEIVGSFDGLICLCFSRWGDVKDCFRDDRPWTTFLWNPSVRRHLVLPLPPILPQMRGRLGFGGSGDGDHKVVRILCLDLNHEGEEVVGAVRPFVRGGNHAVTAEIYSLNSGEWRILQFDLNPERSFMPGQVFLQGKTHWTSCIHHSPGKSTRVVTSFSIDEETFQDLSFPASDVDFGQVWISVVGETIGFLDVHFLSSCYVWVMQEYGNASSWAKLYNMEFDLNNSRFLQLEDAFKVWKDVEVFPPTNHGLADFSSEEAITAVGDFLSQHMWEELEDSFVFVAKHVDSLALLDRPDAVSDVYLLPAPTASDLGNAEMEDDDDDDWLAPDEFFIDKHTPCS